jgi:hypothetical protein
VQPAWRDELFRRITAKGVKVQRAQYDSASRYIDRLLDQRVAQLMGGDSTAKRHDLKFDSPLRTALDLMEKGTSQKDLLALAASESLKQTAHVVDPRHVPADVTVQKPAPAKP